MTDPEAPPAAPAAGPPPLVRRQRRLDPVYDLARFLLAWSFRIGAGLLALGVAVALLRREPLDTRAAPFREVIPAALAGRADGIVDLAILWFMASPVVVVVAVAAGFARAGDRRYAAVSLLVLAILGLSIALAAGR